MVPYNKYSSFASYASIRESPLQRLNHGGPVAANQNGQTAGLCNNTIDLPGDEGNVTVALRFKNCDIAE